MLTHSDQKLHQCSMCCKAFKQKEHLDEHIGFHIGVHSFKCLFCTTKFRFFYHEILAHLQTHFNDICQKQFKCLVCDKVFYGDLASLKHLNAPKANIRMMENQSQAESDAETTFWNVSKAQNLHNSETPYKIKIKTEEDMY